jgi:hypothetical protein
MDQIQRSIEKHKNKIAKKMHKKGYKLSRAHHMMIKNMDPESQMEKYEHEYDRYKESH